MRLGLWLLLLEVNSVLLREPIAVAAYAQIRTQPIDGSHDRSPAQPGKHACGYMTVHKWGTGCAVMRCAMQHHQLMGTSVALPCSCSLQPAPMRDGLLQAGTENDHLGSCMTDRLRSNSDSWLGSDQKDMLQIRDPRT